MAELKRRMIAIRTAMLPASHLAKACDYALRIWPSREVCLEHCQVQLDTNHGENAMRPVAHGRKSRLHIGDKKAGPKIAVIMSVLATCRRLEIHPREYLLDVMPKLGAMTTNEVKHCTPLARKQSHASGNRQIKTRSATPLSDMEAPDGYKICW